MSLPKESVQEKVIELVASVNNLSKEMVLPEQNLQSMGIDDLDLLELVMNLEEHFSIHITDNEVEKIKQVDQLINLVYIKTEVN